MISDGQKHHLPRGLRSTACASLLVTASALASPLAAASPAVLHVCAQANVQAADGSASNPFPSLEGARDQIRQWKADSKMPTSGVVVQVAAGRYYFTRPFTLGAEDSGSAEAPIIYRGSSGQATQLTGAIHLSQHDFAPVQDAAVRARIPESARDSVLQIHLGKLATAPLPAMPLLGHGMKYLEKVTDYNTGEAAPELFFGNKALTVARWPDEGFATVAEVLAEGSTPRLWHDDMKGATQSFQGGGYIPPEKREHPPLGFAFREGSDRALRWRGAADAMLYGYWSFNWADQSVQIADVDATGTIRTIQPSAYGVRQGQRFYVYNLLEELDSPGEWYIDREHAILYLYPPTGWSAKAPSGSEPEAEGLQLSLFADAFFKIENASYLQIENLHFSASRGDAVRIHGGEHISISQCAFSKLAEKAVVISGGNNHRVYRSTIADTGSGGILCAGGDRHSLRPANHTIEHNRITRFSRLARTYSPAIDLFGVGHTVFANQISEGPHIGIRFDGNDHLIEANDISRVCLEADDMGAIYAGRDASAHGTVIRRNYVHNIPFLQSGMTIGRHGVYLDDQFGGTLIEENVFHNIGGVVVVINGGRHNIIRANTFISDESFSQSGNTHRYAAIAITNIGMDVRRYGVGNLSGRMPINDGIDIHSAPYIEKYPHLATNAHDEPEKPKFNAIENNFALGLPLIVYQIFRGTDMTEAMLAERNHFEGNTVIAPGP